MGIWQCGWQVRNRQWEAVRRGATWGALSISLVAVLTGCASTPSRPQGEGGVLFSRPPGVVQTAAVNALTVSGFEIKKSEPLYVEGFRPRKIGLFVGSGGESAGVWLDPVDGSRTRVRVDTAKSFVGIVGQRSWDDQILAEMEKELGKRE